MPNLGNRKIPDLGMCPAPAPHLEARTYKLRLVTPMFGGGSLTGQIDVQRPIRASSIRGQLRHWWRLINRSRAEFITDGRLDLAKLRSREFEIWGSTDSPSPVQLQVKSDQIEDRDKLEKGADKQRPFRFNRTSPEAYALFSAIEKVPPIKELLKDGYEFELTVSWPNRRRMLAMRELENDRRKKNHEVELPSTIEDIADDVVQSIEAWIDWGGIGARTRRGLGSLQLLDPSNALREVHVPAGCRLFVPLHSAAADAMEGWRYAVAAYQQFRQSFRGPGRSKQVPGRSRWPEPDSIRRITQCKLTGWHDTEIVNQVKPNFPRAILGLPIVFHFADGQKGSPPNRDCNPGDVELKPGRGENGSRERMASPIITKPVLLLGKWYAGILILPHDHALSVDCELVGTKWKWKSAEPCSELIPNSQIVGPQLRQLCPPGMADPLRGHENAISAFIGFLKTKKDRPAEVDGPTIPIFGEWRAP